MNENLLFFLVFTCSLIFNILLGIFLVGISAEKAECEAKTKVYESILFHNGNNVELVNEKND